MKTKKSSRTLYLKETGNSYFDDACERQAFRTDVRTEFIDTTINHPVADEQTRCARMDEKLCEQP